MILFKIDLIIVYLISDLVRCHVFPLSTYFINVGHSHFCVTHGGEEPNDVRRLFRTDQFKGLKLSIEAKT